MDVPVIESTSPVLLNVVVNSSRQRVYNCTLYQVYSCLHARASRALPKEQHGLGALISPGE